MIKTALAFDDEDPKGPKQTFSLTPFYGITGNNAYYITSTTTHISNILFTNIIIDSGNKNGI